MRCRKTRTMDCFDTNMIGGIPVRNDRIEYPSKTDNGLFDNYPLGTLLAVAWEGGGAAGTLASISKGIVTLGGPGLITLDGLVIPVDPNNYITIKIEEIVAVAPITGLPLTAA